MALPINDDILLAGARHHMSLLKPYRSNDMTVTMIKPQELFFNTTTIDKIVTQKAIVHEIIRKCRDSNSKPFSLEFVSLTGRRLKLEVCLDYTVADVKALIQDREGIPADRLRLFGKEKGKELEDGKKLRDYEINEKSVIHIIRRVYGSELEKLQELQKESFAPEYNFDFTKIAKDEGTYYRGSHVYIRPIGSMRFAIKVLNLYENNEWLGADMAGRRSNDPAVKEWPVAYYGTTDPRAAEIVKAGGLKLENGCRFKFGHGIYCTPNPQTALAYALPYEYEKEQFKLIIQARVDPTRCEMVSKETHGVAGLDDYWIAKEDDAIRPYSICIYRF